MNTPSTLLVLSTLFYMVVMVMSDRLMEPNSMFYLFSLLLLSLEKHYNQSETWVLELVLTFATDSYFPVVI